VLHQIPGLGVIASAGLCERVTIIRISVTIFVKYVGYIIMRYCGCETHFDFLPG
jgi:hypothetical protein